MGINRSEIERLTEAYGGPWGINHTRRLLALIEVIAEGQSYDSEVVWLAAHLHDWGAYAPWAQKGLDHALRSRQVAETILTERDYPRAQMDLVLEAIALHHSGGAGRNMESILLADADALDFLGVVGVLRDFAKKPKDLREAYETTRRRREALPETLCLASSRVIAARRIAQMEDLLAVFEADTFGYF